MRNLRYQAWISWPRPQKGGRADVPTDLYWMDARFENQRNWPAEGWTLVVQPIRLFNGNRLQIARIDFLADGAPHELIQAGVRFELLDGLRVIAHGLVVDANEHQQVTSHAVEEVLLV